MRQRGTVIPENRIRDVKKPDTDQENLYPVFSCPDRKPESEHAADIFLKPEQT